MTKSKEEKEFLAFHGMPETTEYIGWAVNLPETDEFLSVLESTKESLLKGWAKTPELAMIFETEKEAKKAIKIAKKGCAVIMFDIGDQILTLTSE